MKKRDEFKNLKIESDENANVKTYKENKKKPGSPQRDAASTNSEEHNVSKSKKPAFEKNKTSFLDDDVPLKKHEFNQQKSKNKEVTEKEKDQEENQENKENFKKPEKKEKTSSSQHGKNKTKSKSESPKKKNREEDKHDHTKKEKQKDVENKNENEINQTEKDDKAKSAKNEENKETHSKEQHKKGNEKKNEDAKEKIKNKVDNKENKEKENSKEKKNNLKNKKNDSQEKNNQKDKKDHNTPQTLPLKEKKEKGPKKDCELVIPLVNASNDTNPKSNVKTKLKSKNVQKTVESADREKIELKNIKQSFQRFVFLLFCFICWNLAYLIISFLEFHDLYNQSEGNMRDQYATKKVIIFIAIIIYFGSWILNLLSLRSLENSKSLVLYKFVFFVCFYLTIGTIIGYTTYFLNENSKMKIYHYYKIFYESILAFSIAVIFLIKYLELQIFTGFSIFVYIFILKIFSEDFDLYKKEIILYLLNTGQYFFIILFGCLAIQRYPLGSNESLKKNEEVEKKTNRNLDILIDIEDNNQEKKKSKDEDSKIIGEDKIKLRDSEKKMGVFAFSMNHYGKLMILFDNFWNILEFTSLAKTKFNCEKNQNFDDLIKIDYKMKSIAVTGNERSKERYSQEIENMKRKLHTFEDFQPYMMEIKNLIKCFLTEKSSSDLSEIVFKFEFLTLQSNQKQFENLEVFLNNDKCILMVYSQFKNDQVKHNFSLESNHVVPKIILDLQTMTKNIILSIESSREIFPKNNNGDIFNLMYSNAIVISSTLNNLKDFYDMTQSKLKLIFMEFDLKTYLDEILLIFSAQAKKKDIIFSINYDKKLSKIVISDPHKMAQLILNLLCFRLKYTNKGEIALDIIQCPTKEEIKFEIKDHGLGASEKNIKTFQEYFDLNKNNYFRSLDFIFYFGSELTVSKEILTHLGKNLEIKCDKKKGNTITFILCSKRSGEITRPVENLEDSLIESSYIEKKNLNVDYCRLTTDDSKNKVWALNSNRRNDAFISNFRQIIDKQYCTCSKILIVDDDSFNINQIQNICKIFGFESDFVSDIAIAIEKLNERKKKLCGWECSEYKLVLLYTTEKFLDNTNFIESKFEKKVKIIGYGDRDIDKKEILKFPIVLEQWKILNDFNYGLL